MDESTTCWENAGPVYGEVLVLCGVDPRYLANPAKTSTFGERRGPSTDEQDE